MLQSLDEYETNLLAQREQRAQMLLGDRSWLALAGLYWLRPGRNSFGRSAGNDFVLPGTTTPDHAGHFHFDGKSTTVHAAAGVSITTDDGPISSLEMQPDTSGAPDFITLGDLVMVVIQRGERVGIRLYDQGSPARQHFAGLHWYPVDAAYRVVAQFIPYDLPKPLTIVNVLGDRSTVGSPGKVRFALNGVAYDLDAQPAGNGLFFNFRDETSGDTTYGAGRFLYSAAPEDGTVVLDFNRATNPYCAYTAFATCPLPPPQNHLPVRIEAGEMNY